MSDTHRRLDDLKAAAQPRIGPAYPHAQPLATGLAEILGGCEACCAGKLHWVIETAFDVAWPGHAARTESLDGPLHHQHARHSPPLVIEPHRTLVVDIETGGFAGMPVFLIGIVSLDQRPLSVLQLLARDYPEEEGILRAMAALAAEHDTWVTFNGKSFDEPFLRDRATLHRVQLAAPSTHVDLLHAARRAWPRELPNHRLGTLEEHILHRRRVGDVPSSDVPDLFHHFMRTGNAAPLRPVLEHNRIDLVSATELLLRLATPAPVEGLSEPDPGGG